MELIEVLEMAKELMQQHGLTDWRFKFDNAKTRYGYCNPSKKEISVSWRLAELNPMKETKDTILHEIAHALVGCRNGHNWIWQSKALSIGCNGKTCHNATMSEPNYIAFCPNCNKQHNFFRKTKHRKACIDCCRKYNRGYFDSRFILELQPNK